ATPQSKRFCLRRPCTDMVGSIFCLLRWWLCCTSTTWPLPRSELKSYGGKYTTSWCHQTKLTSLVVPTQAKIKYDNFLCHIALQRHVRDLFLLGRAEPEGRSLLGRDSELLRKHA